ncbi:MAG: hypothetical protein ACFCGT_04975 [Sandaracinaceae bacterium]
MTDPATLSSPEPSAASTPAAETFRTTFRPDALTLFRHSRREQWGLGTVMRRLDDRVMLVFQDGRQRTFKKGYCHLFDLVDKPLDATERIVDALQSMVDGEPSKSRRAPRQPITLDDQIAYFRELYAGGFQDEDYEAEHRGDGRKRPLKRHRDALVEAASDRLSADTLDTALADGDAGAIHEAAGAVVATTDLVTAKERKRFQAIDASHHEALATGLRRVLYGEARIAKRMDAWVRILEDALGEAPSWNLATALVGAVRPASRLVVRPRVVQEQAKWMAPGLRVSDRPVGLLYERLCEMAVGTRGELEAAGLAPRDLLDVVDFMWLTLKPAGRTAIREMKRTRGITPPQQAEQNREAA